jgi:hypothetical protein
MATGKSDAATAVAWCIACIAVGAAVVHAFPGAYVQDPALHFLRARWMWSHPWMLVDVWDRPLFTLVYAIPAALPGTGAPYLAAKISTIGITAVAAWLTWELARGYRLERPALVIPLMWLQPCVFLLCAETTPEPLFALMFALALVLYQRGRLVQSALSASLLILIRPEGIALAALWAWCTIRDARAGQTVGKRVATASALAVAPVVWWYLAAQITQDPWFIAHNWPPLSASWRSILTGGGVENPVRQWAEIVGVVLAVPFAVGSVGSLWQRRLGMPLAAVLTVAIAHLVVGGAGIFGWAPIPSAFVCVAPAIAVLTLAGWNALSATRAWVPTGARRGVGWAVATVVLVVSLVGDVLVLDSQPSARDWRPISTMTRWFSDHPRPIRRLIWSSAYADVLFGHDPMESALTYGDRDRVVTLLSGSPSGTLVEWDADIGPSWYHLTGDEIEHLGYITLQRTAASERGIIPAWVEATPGIAGLRRLTGLDQPLSVRAQAFWLLYRP